jgi:GAF domain-containing protein
VPELSGGGVDIGTGTDQVRGETVAKIVCAEPRLALRVEPRPVGGLANTSLADVAAVHRGSGLRAEHEAVSTVETSRELRLAVFAKGLLAPAREFLIQAPGEDVRLSVLVPEGQDFRMKWMAGHRLVSKQDFRLRIGESFSRFAFQTGQIESSEDVDSDPRFQPHPRAERPYYSIISVPIRSGDDVVAVFNVVSTLPYAFTEADDPPAPPALPQPGGEA